MSIKTPQWQGLFACLLIIHCPCSSLAQPPGVRAGIPDTVQDAAVPMIALPTQFTSQRVNSDRRIPAEGFVNVADLRGPDCVRHVWFLPGDDVRLVIHVDGAPRPQVDMPLKAFFGVMHGLEPYFVDCAAYTVLPNPAPGMPGTPGYNLYLPIPFSQSCRITHRRDDDLTGWRNQSAFDPRP